MGHLGLTMTRFLTGLGCYMYRKPGDYDKVASEILEACVASGFLIKPIDLKTTIRSWNAKPRRLLTTYDQIEQVILSIDEAPLILRRFYNENKHLLETRFPGCNFPPANPDAEAVPIRKRVVQDVRALQLLRFLQEDYYCPIIMQFLLDHQQFQMPEVGDSVQLDISRIIANLEPNQLDALFYLLENLDALKMADGDRETENDSPPPLVDQERKRDREELERYRDAFEKERMKNKLLREEFKRFQLEVKDDLEKLIKKFKN